MKERRYVKFKVDIYDDTKTKIIDQRPERDFIHYFFARSIVLAGKADCEGYLYMAKDIPYTIETLAIEFNREVYQIKSALDVLIELKMIEVMEENIYRVKGFVKHQNIKVKEEAKINDQDIKVKEKVKINDQEEGSISINNKEAQIEDNSSIKNNIKIEDNEKIKDEGGAPEVIHGDIRKIDSNIVGNLNEENIKVNSGQDNVVILGMKNSKQSNKNNKKSNKNNKSNLNTKLAVEEIEDDDPIFCITEGEMPPLSEGESIIRKFSFN